MSVCCECCVLSGRGLCDGLIILPEESYRLWCVAVCDIRNLIYEEPNVNQLWLINQRDPLAGGDLITLVYKLGSTLAYRILRSLTAG